jgi:hypothetical protein
MALIVPKRKSSGVDVADVFSTDLYTGNGSTQSITNGIDLSNEGGLVWSKIRNGTYGHRFTDTERGVGNFLQSSDTTAELAAATGLTSFNTDGHSLGNNVGYNENTKTYAAWTFRKSPKFFDVVTYTGTGSARTVAHDLGSVPGMVIIKRTDSVGDWLVYHRTNAPTHYMYFNTTSGLAGPYSGYFNNTAPTDTVFSVGNDSYVNLSGGSYVAYIFAHDTEDNGIIQCGSYTGNGSATGPVITLGWEPQWLMVKNTNGPFSENWVIMDKTRSTANTRDDLLFPNLSNAEVSGSRGVDFLSTGFQPVTTSSEMNSSGKNYVYMAIRKEGV